MKNQIIIQDWAGNILFDGDYRDEQVDTVLDANRCPCRFHDEIIHEIEICQECDDTGYIGEYLCSTNQSKTCKEAVKKYLDKIEYQSHSFAGLTLLDSYILKYPKALKARFDHTKR